MFQQQATTSVLVPSTQPNHHQVLHPTPLTHQQQQQYLSVTNNVAAVIDNTIANRRRSNSGVRQALNVSQLASQGYQPSQMTSSQLQNQQPLPPYQHNISEQRTALRTYEVQAQLGAHNQFSSKSSNERKVGGSSGRPPIVQSSATMPYSNVAGNGYQAGGLPGSQDRNSSQINRVNDIADRIQHIDLNQIHIQENSPIKGLHNFDFSQSKTSQLQQQHQQETVPNSSRWQTSNDQQQVPQPSTFKKRVDTISPASYEQSRDFRNQLPITNLDQRKYSEVQPHQGSHRQPIIASDPNLTHQFYQDAQGGYTQTSNSTGFKNIQNQSNGRQAALENSRTANQRLASLGFNGSTGSLHRQTKNMGGNLNTNFNVGMNPQLPNRTDKAQAGIEIESANQPASFEQLMAGGQGPPAASLPAITSASIPLGQKNLTAIGAANQIIQNRRMLHASGKKPPYRSPGRNNSSLGMAAGTDNSFTKAASFNVPINHTFDMDQYRHMLSSDLSPPTQNQSLIDNNHQLNHRELMSQSMLQSQQPSNTNSRRLGKEEQTALAHSLSPTKNTSVNQTIADRFEHLKKINQSAPAPSSKKITDTLTNMVKLRIPYSGKRQQPNNNFQQPQRLVRDSDKDVQMDDLEMVGAGTSNDPLSDQRAHQNPEAGAPFNKQVAMFMNHKSKPTDNSMTSVYQKSQLLAQQESANMSQSQHHNSKNASKKEQRKNGNPSSRGDGYSPQYVAAAAQGHQYTVNQHLAENTNLIKRMTTTTTTKSGEADKSAYARGQIMSANQNMFLARDKGAGGRQHQAQVSRQHQKAQQQSPEEQRQRQLKNLAHMHEPNRGAMLDGARFAPDATTMVGGGKLGQSQTTQQIQTGPTKRQRLSLSQSKESASDGNSPDHQPNANEVVSNIGEQDNAWSHNSVCSQANTNSLISENSADSQDPATGKKKDGEAEFTTKMLNDFNTFVYADENTPQDPVKYAVLKVANFIENNPLNQVFIKREKARLPYSVFKPHATEVCFLKSIFTNRPPTAFFPYPSYVHLDRTADRIRKYARDEIEYLFMSFKISDTTHIYNAVVNTCKNAGFNMVEGGNEFFNVQWTGYITNNDIKHLNKYQKTNHFPGSSQLGRKDLLWRNMNRLRQKHPQDFVIAPMSYLLTEDYEQFQLEREHDPSALWILKPVAASCGRGIKVIQAHTRINKREGILACKYISNPHLINGLKYDLRVYVLVTSFNPLKVYMYRDGLVRFATEKYSNDPSQLTKKFIHLTNFSVNKKSAKFVKNADQGARKAAANGGADNSDGEDGDAQSSKWDFKQLSRAYEKQGLSFPHVLANFKDLIIKTLISVEPHIVSSLMKNPTNRVNCFEIYGFDIMVDANMKPWVLEVNVLPSLSSSSPFDKRIKTMLVCDALTCIGLRGYDKTKFHAQSTDVLGLAPFSPSMTYQHVREREKLDGTEKLSKDELEMIMDLDEEFLRKGNFERVFPLQNNAFHYEQYFEYKRYTNVLLQAYLHSEQAVKAKLLMPKHKQHYNSSV